MTDTSYIDLGDWEGALGPQSDDDPVFYELNVNDDNVTLIGPSPGMKMDYDREEFENLVKNGEWILADDDWENEVYQTPNGERPY